MINAIGQFEQYRFINVTLPVGKSRSSLIQFFKQICDPLLMLQPHREDNRLKAARPRQVDVSMHLLLDTREQPIKNRLILGRQSPPEWNPATVFLSYTVAERRHLATYAMISRGRRGAEARSRRRVIHEPSVVVSVILS